MRDWAENERLWLDSLRITCGMPPALGEARYLSARFGELSYERLSRTEWSSRFESLMRNRLILGAIRYGVLQASNKPKWDRIGSIIQRLKAYQNDPNQEHLVDVANLALLEFLEPSFHNAYWEPVDDGELHQQILAQ